FLVGDANCDGTVNALDAALILQFSAGLLNSLPCPMGADANADGTVNALDAALVLQFSAGLLRSLPP
ncbi:MAG: dockerin type I repeat-containing protein, partial [Chloroflexi bacterium]|nr:dockerin type I repeat-containing protein [Chloroflexota bacterium]